jgi:hypothetical protein
MLVQRITRSVSAASALPPAPSTPALPPPGSAPQVRPGDSVDVHEGGQRVVHHRLDKAHRALRHHLGVGVARPPEGLGPARGRKRIATKLHRPRSHRALRRASTAAARGAAQPAAGEPGSHRPQIHWFLHACAARRGPPVHEGAAQHALLRVVEQQGVVHAARAAADGGGAAAGAERAPGQRADGVADDGGAVDHDAAVAQALQGGFEGGLVAPGGWGVGVNGCLKATARAGLRCRLLLATPATSARVHCDWIDLAQAGGGALAARSSRPRHLCAAGLRPLHLPRRSQPALRPWPQL